MVNEFENVTLWGFEMIANGTAQDIGHDWPSVILNDDAEGNKDPAASFNASSIIIDFFAAHPLT